MVSTTNQLFLLLLQAYGSIVPIALPQPLMTCLASEMRAEVTCITSRWTLGELVLDLPHPHFLPSGLRRLPMSLGGYGKQSSCWPTVDTFHDREINLYVCQTAVIWGLFVITAEFNWSWLIHPVKSRSGWGKHQGLYPCWVFSNLSLRAKVLTLLLSPLRREDFQVTSSLSHYDEDPCILFVSYIVYLIQPKFKMKSQK